MPPPRRRAPVKRRVVKPYVPPTVIIRIHSVVDLNAPLIPAEVIKMPKGVGVEVQFVNKRGSWAMIQTMPAGAEIAPPDRSAERPRSRARTYP